MTCSGNNPLYWDPIQNLLVPLDAGTLKTTTWNYTQFDCDSDNAGAPALYNGFTSGEIVNSVFLFWIFSLLLFGGIILWIRGIKIKQ